MKNKQLFQQLKLELNRKLDELEDQMNQNKLSITDLEVNMLELVFKTQDQDNPYLKSLDSETSAMKVRILGLSPIRDVFDDNGNFKYEEPMFWVYYPNIREELAKHRVFMEGNDASPLTWEDFMEMRFFSSYVYKESNVKDNRLGDYLSGVDLLMEGERIKADIFNWEHDLWQY